MADYDFMAVWTSNCMYQPYWVCGSKGYLVHIAHIPALMWNQKRVHGLFWDAVIPTNEGVPVADSEFIEAWTLYCLYQPYWVCGCEGYLVHKTHIPIVSPWQIIISWQFGPQTVCTSHIRYVGRRVFCSYSSYTRLTVESKSRIWPSLGCCGSHKRGHPCGRL